MRFALLVLSCMFSRAVVRARPAVQGRAFGAAAGPPPPLSLKANDVSRARNADADAVFVISGASRGIGAGFCDALLARSRGTVVALSRDPERSEALARMRETYGASRVRSVAVDITDEASVTRAAAEVSAMVSQVDMLINCAGLLHEGSADRMPERSLTTCSPEWMQQVYAVNAIGPVLLTRELMPLLTAQGATPRERIIANLSARVSSVSDNRLGGWWSYRMAKAALNMATRNMALELGRRKVLAVALHPGTVDTGLSKPFQKNVRPDKLFTTAFSVERLLDVLECIEPVHSGSLFAWDGERIEF